MNRIELTPLQSDLMVKEWKGYYLLGDFDVPKLTFLSYYHAKGIDLQWGIDSERCTIPSAQQVFFLLQYCT